MWRSSLDKLPHPCYPSTNMKSAELRRPTLSGVKTGKPENLGGLSLTPAPNRAGVTFSYPRSSPDTKTEPTQGRTTRTVHGITLNRVADSIRSSGLTPAIQSNNRDVAQANYLGRCMVKEQSASIFAPLYSAAMTHNSHSRQTHTTLYRPN